MITEMMALQQFYVTLGRMRRRVAKRKMWVGGVLHKARGRMERRGRQLTGCGGISCILDNIITSEGSRQSYHQSQSLLTIQFYKTRKGKPSNHVVSYFTMTQTCSSESQSDKRPLIKAISQQPIMLKRVFKPENGSQQGTLGRKIPQIDKRTQLQMALRKKQHESKQKTEEIKSKLEKYSSNLMGNGNTHVKAQIQQICKAVNTLSDLRDKQIGKRSFLLGTKQLKRYEMLDDALLTQKKITLQNIINKSQGLPLKKSRIKMIEIDNSDIIPNQLKDLQKKTSITSMEKLQLLMKTECGWIAIAKNKDTGIFMVDVSLIDEQGWKVITQLTAP